MKQLFRNKYIMDLKPIILHNNDKVLRELKNIPICLNRKEGVEFLMKFYRKYDTTIPQKQNGVLLI